MVIYFGDTFAENILIVFNSSFQQVKVLIGVLFQLTDSHSQLICLFENNCFNKFFFFFQSGLKVRIELINLTINLVLQFIEILLYGSKSAFNIFAILFSILQMITKLLCKFGKYTLHFTVFFSYHLHYFLYFRVNIMAQLSCSFCSFTTCLTYCKTQFFVGS